MTPFAARKLRRQMFPLALSRVKRGLAGHYRAFGHSMEPVIPSGSRITIEPLDVEKIEVGDIVLVKVGDATMLHLVKTIDAQQRRFEISGTSAPSGWTSFDCVYAICTRIDGREVPGAARKARRHQAQR